MSTKSVANLECWSRVIVICYYTENLQTENYTAIHYLRMWFVFELWFPSRIVSAHLFVTMTSWHIERVINENHRNYLRNLSICIKWKKKEIWLSPMTIATAEMSKGQSDNTNNATKKFNYTVVADRLRTVSWSNNGHPTGVVNLVYD